MLISPNRSFDREDMTIDAAAAWQRYDVEPIRLAILTYVVEVYATRSASDFTARVVAKHADTSVPPEAGGHILKTLRGR